MSTSPATDPAHTQVAQSRLPADPVIEAYKQHVDRTLLRERLARDPAGRLEDLVALPRFAEELARAGRAALASR
jgi:hypothetical protein